MSDVLEDTRSKTLDPDLKDLIETNDRSKKGYIFCIACEHVIGHVNDRVDIMGAHEHSMTNPYGVTHTFGCYSEAPGVDLFGEPTAADTWFPGFSWRLACCEGCGQHMGWMFERNNESFCGLIVSQIRAG